MYAWLTVDTQAATPELSAVWYRSSTQSPPMLAPGELERKRTLLAGIVKDSYAHLGNNERERLRQQADPILRFITGDAPSQNFAMHMVLAHHRLPQVTRSTREALIDRRIHDYFGDVVAPPAHLTDGLAMLRQVALLVPDTMLDAYVRTECAQHYRNLLMFQAARTPSLAPPPGIVKIHQVAALIAGARDMEILPALYTAFSVCLPADRDVFVALVASAHILGCGDAFEAISDAMETLPAPTELSFRIGGLIEALTRVLTNCQQPPDEPLSTDDVIAAQLARMVQQIARTNEQTLVNTVAAMRAGIPMGPKGDESKTVLAVLDQRIQQLEERMTPGRMRAASQPLASADPPREAQDVTDPPRDLDPVHAWSVNRLLRWIEGPLASRAGSQPARIDRNAIATREARESRDRRLRAGAQAKQKSGGQGKPAAARAAEAFTANDIDMAVQGALSATARFFIDDINELLPLAAALQAPQEAMDACHRLLDPLTRLLRPGVKDDEARSLLGQAEAAIATLRSGVRLAEVSLQKQERFGDRLASALAAEPLVLGKQHGGVIDCRMNAADWPWAAQTYHRRWLPRARSVSIDGNVVVLPSDQALALYVTGSSLSHYLFDVSVHLWRRRPDRESAPGQGDALYPPMNEDDWYDTYLPCCVLHVPS